MTPSPSSRRPAATHGSLSARQRQDFAWAARTARKEGVKLVVHGVTVSRDNLPPPANESAGQPGQQRRRQVETTAPSHGASGAQQPAEIPGAPAGAATETSSPGAEGVQQMETTSSARGSAKRQQREARRWEEHLQRLRITHKWATLTFLVARAARAKYRGDTFTAWMRSRLSPRRDARRKLRSVFWQEWTRPQFGGSVVDPVLGLTSHRDEFIRARVKHFEAALEAHTAAKLREYLPEEVEDELVEFATTGFDPVEIQAAISASLDADNHARSPSDRQAGMSSLKEAGIPETPGSARARKRRGGRK